MEKNSKFFDMTIENLNEYRDRLNEAEFVVRSCMNINDEKSIVEGTKLLRKIALERERVNKLIDVQLDPGIFEKNEGIIEPEFDDREIAEIDHKIAEDYMSMRKRQEKFDWDVYFEVVPKLLVEQNEILRDWPALMAEAARQEILPKISALPRAKQQEIFMKFMDRVERERKKFTSSEKESGEDSEKESGGEKAGDLRIEMLEEILWDFQTHFEEEINRLKGKSTIAKKKRCRHLNPDNTFKGGFKGCVAHFMECQGLEEENAKRLCAYIGRRAGKNAGRINKEENIESIEKIGFKSAKEIKGG